jgi:hypothetical protein
MGFGLEAASQGGSCANMGKSALSHVGSADDHYQ